MICTVSRYIKNAKFKKTKIYLSIYYDNKRIQISSGLQIPIKDWNQKTKSIKNSSAIKYEIDKALNQKEREITKYIEKILNSNRKSDIKSIRSELKQIIEGKSEKKVNFHQTLSSFIENRYNSNLYKDSTAKNYIPLKKLCIRYEKKYGKIEFDKINDRFMEKFYNFLINENEAIHNNYAKKQFSNMKTFLNDCFKKGIIDNTLFREFRPKNNKKSTKVDIRLDSDELSNVESYVPETNTLEKTKDLFLIQCYTGLRVSDLMKLDATSINDSKSLIKISTQKTDATAHIPISRKLHTILDKYNYKDYPRYADQVYNRNIKELCKNAGISMEVKTKQYKGSNVLHKNYEKWEIMTSNIARKTFITHLVEEGFAIEEIKIITGHKKNQTVENYINFTQNELLDRVQAKFKSFN